MNSQTVINKILEIDPTNTSIAAEKRDLEHLRRYLLEAEAAYAAKDYRKVISIQLKLSFKSFH